MLSLYLHFPFCKRKCFYCDFCSAAAGQAEIAAYCSALEQEISLMAAVYGHMPVDTVFLGGGTPSVVPASMLKQVFKTLRKHFELTGDVEFTSEANPGTLTEAWMDVLTGAGMNRLSLGVQAMQPQLLATLGRVHDFPQALDAIALAHRYGVHNVNADIMFALPGQTRQAYLDTLEALANAGVTHLSAYSLILESGTPLAARVAQGEMVMPDEDAAADMLEAGIDLLKAKGYARYEISNFAQEGYACRHNLGYWQQKHYLGLGVSAASHLPARELHAAYLRRQNTLSRTAYVQALSGGLLPPAEETPIGQEEAMFETVMLGLRTLQGVQFDHFQTLHGLALPTVYAAAIERLKREGLLCDIDSAMPALALNRRGLAVQNTAMMAFMPD